MENQHRKITGYRDLSKEEVDMMNMIKEHGQAIGKLIGQMEDDDEVDKRWLAIGRTDLQTGLMALTRSIAKPTTF